ncbi:hypothetical protein DP187_21760 [Enterobacter cloacae]|nr:hypothetical protein DP187_21760 [Enterobacter cloacae]
MAEITINVHRKLMTAQPVVYCIPDTKDSKRFISRCYNNDVNVIILIKRKWLATTDLTNCIAYILVDDFENEKEAIKQATTAVIEAVYGLETIDYFIAFAEMNLYLLNDITTHIKKDPAASNIIRSFRDKRVMRQLASEHNVPNPLFKSADELSSPRAFDNFIVEVMNLAKEKQNPVGFVLKPCSDCGSAGVKVFSDPNALYHSVLALDKPELYLVEEKISGRLLHVDTAIYNRKIIYQAIGAYDCSLLETEKYGHQNFMWHTLGTETALGMKLTEFNKTILRVFNLNYGFTHTEIFVEDNTNALYLCETAARPPGLSLFDLHALASGKHAFDIFVDTMSGLHDANNELLDMYRTIGTVVFNPEIGILKEVTSLADIADEYTLSWEQTAQPGTLFDKNHYATQVAQIICSTQDESHCVSVLKNYAQQYKCAYEKMKE